MRQEVVNFGQFIPLFNSQNGGTIWTLNGVILGPVFDFLEQTEIK